MISKDTFIRPGMTAIAAVIALSSTPLLAQDAAPQTATPNAVPTQVTPPTVVPTAPTNAVPTTVTPPAATTVAPQPATPVIELAPPAPAASTPVEAAPPAAVSAPEPAARPTPARAASARAETPRPAASQRNAAPVPAAPAEAQPATPPAAVEAAPAPTAAPLPVEAAPVEEAATPAAATAASNDTLPLIGAGALAVLALGAAGFALSRRRRRDDVFADETVEAEPMMAEQPAPAFARETAPAPVAATAAAASLPNGFDISRYGRHVQAAYRGPTPDNPFVSLKKRLTRAHFYDMQEARAAESGAAPAPRAQTPSPRPAQDRFEVRSSSRGDARTGGFRPAYQH